MNEKQQRVVETAIEVFSRYGVKRTTMGEIAERAGISRQTLYSMYANKDDILTAAMRHATDKTLADIETAWETAATLGEKLDIYFAHAVEAWFERLRSMPDANDLLTGMSEATAAVIRTSEGHKAALLATALAPCGGRLGAVGMTPADLADFIQSASSGFKYSANDTAHLKRLLGALKSSVLTLVDET